MSAERMDALRRLLIISVFVVIGIIGTANLPDRPETQQAQRPTILMPETARITLENLTAMEAQVIINADGESCPLVTGSSLDHSPDTGNPRWLVTCSDGSRYIVFWRDDGLFKALSL